MIIPISEKQKVSIPTPSLSGIGTQVYFPFAHMAVDCGVIDQRALDCRDLVLTHGHADHCGVLGLFVSRRELVGNDGLFTVRVQPYMKEPIERILFAHAEMSGFPVKAVIREFSPGDKWGYCWSRHPDDEYYVKSFALSHNPQSAGLAVMSGNQSPIVATVFDTDYRGLEMNADLLMKYPNIVCECTMMGPSEVCTKHRHLNLVEIVDFFSRSKVLRKLILMHFSYRYSPDDIRMKIALSGMLDKIIPVVE